MKFYKVRDVKSPVRGTEKSAGIDFFIPNDFGPYLLHPGQDILIPSGIKAAIPEGYMLMAANKSSIATSKSSYTYAGLSPKDASPHSTLLVGAEIVDEDYQGEIYLHLVNVGNKPVVLHPGTKIVQFILTPVRYEAVEEVEGPLFEEQTKRGEGGFGSTGSE